MKYKNKIIKAVCSILIKLWNVVSCIFSQKMVFNNIKKIKKKKQIKVIFLVSENEKWSGLGALYSEFELRERFIPIVALTKFKRHNRMDLEKNKEFFSKKKIRIVTIFDSEKNKPVSLLSLKPDLVFYQQPWDLYFNQSPSYCSIKSLSLYLPYSVLVIDNPDHFRLNFHKQLWKIFLDSKLTYERFVEFSNVWKKCIVTGNPKLEIIDDFVDNKEKIDGPVIFAPHHSFEERSLRLATFSWSGFSFLEFAEKHKDIEFIFKPHPRFMFALEKNCIFPKEKINEFYQRLDTLKNIKVYEDGDYGEIFRKSRLLITDCGSFLAEYYLLNKPVVHLASENSVGLTELGELVTEHYYSVKDSIEFIDIMDMLLVQNNDPLLRDRTINRNILELEGVKPSAKIVDFLEKQFEADGEL